jgi:AcrR family transcriptional regulator
VTDPRPPAVAPRADRVAGTRSRAGNAMARTQSAVVAGVGRSLLAHGARRTTMIDIAAAAGIAKATLYNHVRTKGEALALYADAELADVTALLFDGAPGPALAAAADAVATHPVVRRLAQDEPAAFAALLTGPHAVPRRARLGEALEDRLGAARAPLALRWLTSLLADPGTPAERAAGAVLLTAAAPAPHQQAAYAAADSDPLSRAASLPELGGQDARGEGVPAQLR